MPAKARPYEERPCAVCGKMFGPKATSNGRFLDWGAFDRNKTCSRACGARLNSRSGEEKPCTRCGKMFGPRARGGGDNGKCWNGFEKAKFCSKKCAFPNIARPYEEKPCARPGCAEAVKPIRRRKGYDWSSFDIVKFCSKKCSSRRQAMGGVRVLAEDLGIRYGTLYMRLRRAGIDPAELNVK